MKSRISIFILLISVGVLFMVLTSTKSNGSIKENVIPTEQIEKIISNKEDAFVLIGNRNCTSCQKFLPNLEKAAKITDTEIYYLDTENSGNKNFISKNNVTVTPTILVIKNGKVMRSEGAMGYESTRKMLEKGEVE